jgi:hypothetical protein
MTAHGRQQMAYQHYVKKCSGREMKIKKKVKAPPMPHSSGPSKDKVDAETVESPESVTSGESKNGDQ